MSRQSSRLLASASALIVASVALPVAAQDVPNETAASAAGEATPQEQIIVTGTRRTDRTVADSPVPIDVIGGDQLTDNGYTDTNRILNQLVPSFNFPQPAITDGTDAVRPATLRGLAPDQTLVLVNGKRRHTSALLNLNGSVGRGSAAVDLNTIPPIAIERIEVLRDGASSQYGSDAIAGVINVQLRKREGNRAQVTYGKYITTMDDVLQQGGPVLGANGQPVLDTTAGAGGVYQLTDTGRERKRRDGGTLTLATALGLPVGPGGYLNVALQYQDKNPTNRSGADPRQQYPSLAGGLADPREQTIDRYTHRYGDPQTTDFTAFINAGYELSPAAEFYTFASYNRRDSESAGFYRRANDARNRNFSASTTAFVPYYADGFLPLITGDIEDIAAAAGIRGTFGDEWNYDASVVYGTNRFQFGVENSFNVSFGEASQRKFDAGSLRFGQTTANLDLQRTFDFGIGSGVSVAFGAEYRDENFRIVAGDFQSYAGGPFAPAPLFAPAGAQVFPGFRPANEVDASRNSKAAYLELETDLSDALTIQLAGRYEDFSDFGDTINGKAAARFEPIDGIALRGSISTGFRAPSLQQQFYATTSTNNVNGVLVDILTVPVNNPVAVVLGSQPLQPEKSLNWSGGATFSLIPGLNITADYYNIDIDDRIVVTEILQGAAVVSLLQQNGFNNVSSARFFVNGIDTRTRGYEIVGTYRVPDMGLGNLSLTAGFSHNKTKITDAAVLPTLPGLTLFGRQESLRLTRGQPRTKLNVGFDWDSGIFGFTARANRFGEVLIPGVDAARDQVLSKQWVTDAELRAKVMDRLELAVGANNLFDSYPDRVRFGLDGGQNYGLNGYFIPFSQFSPSGFNGRFVYGRVSLDF
ncbi:TonB-dependent receptor [Altererythrobacter sp. TH136]|uniref:TonB-dependent receptor plug domain-containing protein n=1 Tax=Altererythrobacter sp. TH136 TaxID=2067415 RepID=UPI00116559A4|nr:TonB-dependent receptor [Altererythrobacter sp. TH136]QDM40849.1 TonB-dependent receptor [Altererythrobacter sp. TH136]